ncbi:MAG TPA: arsinothricin resistance N-acetyltransferase ArsN1 family B [Opitutaceae bacterium]
MIRTAVPEDAAAICRIYNHYVTNTTITFEETPVTDLEMRSRVDAVQKTLPWLVLEEEGRLVGYAYATSWRTRSAYPFSAESTVYLEPEFCGRGLGKGIYRELIERVRTAGMHRLIGGIALPNTASVGVHESLGFKKVAHFSEVGWKFDKWIDVGYWELSL